METTYLNIWLAKALATRFQKCERLLAACKKEKAVVWIIIALKSKSAVGQSGISKVSISKLRNFTDHWSAPLSSYNINTTGVAQDLLEEHVKKGFLKGGKIQISRECFIIIYLLVLGHPNFRSFSHSSQNANVSFNRLKSQFFDFLILVSLRTFRGMVYLFWSTPSGSSPHRTAPGPGHPSLCGWRRGGLWRGRGRAGAGWPKQSTIAPRQ